MKKLRNNFKKYVLKRYKDMINNHANIPYINIQVTNEKNNEGILYIHINADDIITANYKDYPEQELVVIENKSDLVKYEVAFEAMYLTYINYMTNNQNILKTTKSVDSFKEYLNSNYDLIVGKSLTINFIESYKDSLISIPSHYVLYCNKSKAEIKFYDNVKSKTITIIDSTYKAMKENEEIAYSYFISLVNQSITHNILMAREYQAYSPVIKNNIPGAI